MSKDPPRPSTRRWEVRFLGDPDYGREGWVGSMLNQQETVIEAVKAGESSRANCREVDAPLLNMNSEAA